MGLCSVQKEGSIIGKYKADKNQTLNCITPIVFPTD
jgi:hypothetical protein